jgi:hypothetical protein
LSAIGEAIARGWENFLGRPSGPLSFRLILQPAVATLLAIRAGWRDAKASRPAFLWGVLTHRGNRTELLREGWGDVRNVFLVAMGIDAIYQLIVEGGIYFLEMLFTAVILAFAPYALIRGPVTRLARVWLSKSGARRG